jgi:DNA-binding SARP family transcriptional activator
MEFRVLGPLEVWCDGRRVPVSAAKQRTLLAILLLRAGRVVAPEELIDQRWGERPPTSARKTLHNYVRRIRTTLAAGADARGRAPDAAHRVIRVSAAAGAPSLACTASSGCGAGAAGHRRR